MSGPKTSKYTLTKAQRRALQEQRRIERSKSNLAILHEKIQTLAIVSTEAQKQAELIKERTGNDNDVETLRELRLIFSVSLPDNSPAAASDNSVACFFAGRNTQLVDTRAVPAEINNAGSAADKFTFFEQGKEILVIFHSYSIYHKIILKEKDHKTVALC